MKNIDFLQLREEWTAKRFDLCDRKAKDYTLGDDRLDNFKRISGEFDVHPYKVMGIYTKKHLDSIVRFLRTEGKEKYSEDIKGRIFDAQNYLDLLLGFIEELERLNKPEFRPGENC